MARGKTLTVYLAADLKNFNNGMNRAQGQARGLGGTLKNVLGPALIGAGIAVAGLATKMAIDGVKAAIEDEAAMSKLATTMQNLGLAHDTRKVEDYISVLERSLGIADTELRPAYDRLVRALGDTEKAQDALQLSLDISAGSGKSLTQVTDALGKAYEGNIAGLSRLGAGIDAATIKTGDMDLITRKLSATFDGQAEAAAKTYQGQLKRLSTAADNLKEAFGAGLLSALGDSDTHTQNLVDTMGDLEPVIKRVGEDLGDFAAGIGLIVTEMFKLTGSTEEVTKKTGKYERGILGARDANNSLIDNILPLIPILGTYAGVILGIGENARITARFIDIFNNSMKTSADGIPYYLGGINAINKALGNQTTLTEDSLAADRRMAANRLSIINQGQTLVEKVIKGKGKSAGASSKLNKAEEELTERYDKLNKKLEITSTKLANQTKNLAEAREAVQDYAKGIQQNLLSGIDLEKAFTDQFDDAGQATGKSLLDGFNKQIAQAEYFGNVLTSIKAQGADDELIRQIASLGPVTGAALAQQLIDDGLVKTMSDKWVGVQETTKTLAMQLVPEFLIAGQNSAEEMVKGTAETLLTRQQAFSNMGKSIGKKVGAKFKAEFLADIAAAVKEVGAIQTAARAERVASETARQVAITDQQVGQALAAIIQRSDNRLGLQGVPVLS
jgi:uncharacterized protein